LANIATAGAHLGEQMVKQAEAANYVGVEGALMAAPVASTNTAGCHAGADV